MMAFGELKGMKPKLYQNQRLCSNRFALIIIFIVQAEIFNALHFDYLFF